MKLIELSKNSKSITKYFVMVDDEHFDWLNQWNWTANVLKNAVYACRCLTAKEKIEGSPKKVYLHRVIMNAPKGKDVDHLDSNGLNCLTSNMRVCDRHENAKNQRKKKKSLSKYKGITLNGSGNWSVRIWDKNKAISGGSYKTEVEAAMAYNKLAIEVHKEFANLNIIK